MNYTPDPETGKLPPEYVDVYGFLFLSFLLRAVRRMLKHQRINPKTMSMQFPKKTNLSLPHR